MNIAFFHESILPSRGGCETYLADLARRLCLDRHEVHLYVSRWDPQRLPSSIVYHPLPTLTCPRFLRPWRFSQLCHDAARHQAHDVTMGFDKTWGQDILYPQGGLHLACVDQNLLKFRWGLTRFLANAAKKFDPAMWSFEQFERKQYLGQQTPLIVVNSHMVRDHFRQYYNIPSEEIFVVRSAIDPGRFPENDRPKCRQSFRQEWNIPSSAVVGLFAAMNYRLKGLDPLLHSVQRLLARPEFQARPPVFHLVVAGNPNTAMYQRMAKKLGVANHVLFVGHRGDMRHSYFAADFLVHPTFYDPCSLVVLEAMTCGLPIITTRFNGVSELINDGQEGYVIADPHDHEHLAWCMLQFFDAERRTACGQAARRTASLWTFEHHYRQLLNVFAAAMARNEARRQAAA